MATVIHVAKVERNLGGKSELTGEPDVYARHGLKTLKLNQIDIEPLCPGVWLTAWVGAIAIKLVDMSTVF
jgi:hypothetical protein